jgi:histidine kinase
MTDVNIICFPPKEHGLRRLRPPINDTASAISSVTGRNTVEEGDDFDDLECHGDDDVILFGRETLLQLLHQGYDRAKKGGISEFIVLHGSLGVGKTEVTESLRNPVMENGDGYFCRITFEKHHDNLITYDPFAAITSALMDLCELILQEIYNSSSNPSPDTAETSHTPSNYRLSSTTSDVRLAAEAFRHYVEEQYAEKRAQSEFCFSCRDFLRVISSPKRPLVLVFDNLQWTTKESLNVVCCLISDRESKSTLFVGTYRDDEDITKIRNLHRTLMIASILPTNFIKLENLDKEAVHAFLAHNLSLSAMQSMKAQPLTDLMILKTGGNPFFMVQYLRYLKNSNLITKHSECYSWNLAAIRRDTNAAANILALLKGRLRLLTAESKTVLTYAAFLGVQCQKEVLEVSLGREDAKEVVERSLSWAMKCGLISDNGETSGCVAFAHDHIQDVIKEFVPDGMLRLKTHLRIGQRIKTKRQEIADSLSHESSMSYLLAAVAHLNAASVLIDDVNDIADLLDMNLEAAKFCVENNVFAAAESILQKAIELVQDPRNTDSFVLTLTLNKLLMKCLYSTGKFNECLTVAENALHHVIRKQDKIYIQAMILGSHQANGNLSIAFQLGQEYLLENAIKCPTSMNRVTIATKMFGVKRMTRRRSDDDLLSMHQCLDTEYIEKENLLLSLVSICRSMNNYGYLVTIVLYLMFHGLQAGYTPNTSSIYVMYSIVCMGYGDRYEFNRFSHLAQTLLEHRHDIGCQIRAQVLTLLETYLPQMPLSSKMTLEGVVQEQLYTGHIDSAFWSASHYLIEKIISGLPFQDLESEAARIADLATQFSDPNEIKKIRVIWQFAINMNDEADDSMNLTGDAVVEDELRSNALKQHDFSLIELVCMLKAHIFFYHGNYDKVLQELGKLPSMRNVFRCRLYLFLMALEALSYFSIAKKKPRFVRHTRALIRKLEPFRTTDDCFLQPLLLLLTAEDRKMRHEVENTLSIYNDSIRTASTKGFLNLEVISNHRAAIFLNEMGNKVQAKLYVEEAIEKAEIWSSLKARRLKETYFEYEPILVSHR